MTPFEFLSFYIIDLIHLFGLSYLFWCIFGKTLAMVILPGKIVITLSWIQFLTELKVAYFQCIKKTLIRQNSFDTNIWSFFLFCFVFKMSEKDYNSLSKADVSESFWAFVLSQKKLFCFSKKYDLFLSLNELLSWEFFTFRKCHHL